MAFPLLSSSAPSGSHSGRHEGPSSHGAGGCGGALLTTVESGHAKCRIFILFSLRLRKMKLYSPRSLDKASPPVAARAIFLRSGAGETQASVLTGDPG